MTLIDLMQAFHCVSVGVLDPYEQALWLRLALIWNSKRRIDWFLVSRVELIRETGIKSKDTVDKARKGLEKKGFIQSRATGRTSPRMYHMEDITVRLGDSLEENFSKATTQPSKATTQPSKATTQPRLGYEIATSQSTEIYTESIQSRETPPTPPTVSPEVMKAYQEEIRLVASPRDMATLHDYETMYPQDGWVVKAIERAALRNKRNLGYVGSILRSWKENGYDEEGERRNGTYGQRPRKHREHLTEEEELAKWQAVAKEYGQPY